VSLLVAYLCKNCLPAAAQHSAAHHSAAAVEGRNCHRTLTATCAGQHPARVPGSFMVFLMPICRHGVRPRAGRPALLLSKRVLPSLSCAAPSGSVRSIVLHRLLQSSQGKSCCHPHCAMLPAAVLLASHAPAHCLPSCSVGSAVLVSCTQTAAQAHSSTQRGCAHARWPGRSGRREGACRCASGGCAWCAAAVGAQSHAAGPQLCVCNRRTPRRVSRVSGSSLDPATGFPAGCADSHSMLFQVHTLLQLQHTAAHLQALSSPPAGHPRARQHPRPAQQCSQLLLHPACLQALYID
jgi:hypothetical protein